MSPDSTPVSAALPTDAPLRLQVTSPLDDAVVTASRITVVGVTHPDATVSVNGMLAVPSGQGDFSMELQLSGEPNPISIEVIASSLSGEESSVVLTQISAGGSLQPGSQGLFGNIISISSNNPRAVAGETDIVLSTQAGPAELTATPATLVRIPGLQSASVEQLLDGDRVAALVSQGRAISILVPGNQPLRTVHFRGIVTSINGEAGTISLQSPGGSSITAPWLLNAVGPTGLTLGELVTAVMEQDLASGSLVITGLDTAQASLERLAAAMEVAETEGNLARFGQLKQRLLSNIAGRLTILRGASEWLGASLQVPVLQQLASSLESTKATLARFDAGGPQGDVTGIVTSIDFNRRIITVAQGDLKPVVLSISNDAGFWRAPGGLPSRIADSWLRGDGDTQRYADEFGGRKSRFQQLDLANRVRLRHRLDTGIAIQVLVLPASSLKTNISRVLLELAARGVAMGTVTSVSADSQPPTLKIQDEISGRTLTLSVSQDSALLEGLDPIALSALAGASVDASYDQNTMSVITLNSSVTGDRRERVHGVVHSLVPKEAPGNFIVLTSDGDLRSFDHTRDTMIIRDGRQVTISQVRIGDLVQPDTKYLPGRQDGDSLVVLSLKSPQSATVRGTIRGISNISGTVITVSNNWLELINISVDGNTRLSQQGSQVTVADLAVGQRVLGGEFDPISGLAQNLLIGAPKSLHIRGEITAVHPSRPSIEITSNGGEPTELFVSGSTEAKIILQGILDPYFGDLSLGQTVRLGFYNPSNKQLIKLILD